jgi:hypothetical protein
MLTAALSDRLSEATTGVLADQGARLSESQAVAEAMAYCAVSPFQ